MPEELKFLKCKSNDLSPAKRLCKIVTQVQQKHILMYENISQDSEAEVYFWADDVIGVNPPEEVSYNCIATTIQYSHLYVMYIY